MLAPAILYADELTRLLNSTWFQDKYKWWNNDTYYDSVKVADSSWADHQFVSVRDGKVIGYIGYQIYRCGPTAHNLSIINFTDDKMTFGMDVGQALRDIFEKYHFHKLNFCVVVGNPIEKSYDKMITRFGGRIVGTYRDDTRLIDGRYYDRKAYEVLEWDYFASSGYKALRRHSNE